MITSKLCKVHTTSFVKIGSIDLLENKAQGKQSQDKVLGKDSAID